MSRSKGDDQDPALEEEEGEDLFDEDSEEDEDKDIPNTYENDGFVVDDEEVDDLDDRPSKRARGEEGEERKRKEKKKKLSRLRKRSHHTSLRDELADYVVEEQDFPDMEPVDTHRRRVELDEEEESAEPQGIPLDDEVDEEDQPHYAGADAVPSYRYSDAANPDALEDAALVFGENGPDDFGEFEGDYRDSYLGGEEDYEGQFGAEAHMIDQPEPDLLAKRYQTEADEIIRKTDIPERLQLREIVRDVTDDDSQLVIEAEWIYSNIFERRFNQTRDISKERFRSEYVAVIKQVLLYILKDKLDIPCIATYRKEYIELLRGDQDLWTILDWDEKWVSLKRMKENLMQTYDQVGDTSQVDFYLKLLNSAKSFVEINDLTEHFHFRFGSIAAVSGSVRRPSRRDLYSIYKRLQLDALTARFGLTSRQYAENLFAEDGAQPFLVEDDAEDPSKAAFAYISTRLSDENAVLKAARYMLAVEIVHEPYVRKKVRSCYEDYAVIHVTPTNKRDPPNTEVYNQLKNWEKSIAFINEREDLLILFLHALKLEKEGFVEVTVQVEELQIDSALDFERCYRSDNTAMKARNWNEQRKQVIDEVKAQLKPIMVQHIKTHLSSLAQAVVGNRVDNALEEKLMVGPYGLTSRYRPPRRVMKSDGHGSELADSGHKYPGRYQILSCCMGLETEKTTFVLLDEFGEIDEFMEWKNLGNFYERRAKPNNREPNKPSQLDQLNRDQENRLIQFITTKRRPEVVVVGASGVHVNHFYKHIKAIVERSLGSNVPVIYQPEDVARIYEVSQHAKEHLQQYTPTLRRAISIGRLLRDPLMHISNLWSEHKDILSMKLDPLQSMLPEAELLSYMERAFVRVVNRVGVDINLIVRHKHMQSVLQFVSGLGPRKAKALIEAILAMPKRTLYRRTELIDLQSDVAGIEAIMRARVFVNCAGFLRIRESTLHDESDDSEDTEHEPEEVRTTDILDETRINPESYQLAVKMAVAAFDADTDHESEETMYQYIHEVMVEPHRLDELLLEDYAKELERVDLGKKYITLRDIKAELQQPFVDPRRKFEQPDEPTIFKWLTGTSVHEIREHPFPAIVQFVSYSDRGELKLMILQLENGLTSQYRNDDLRQRYTNGQSVEVYVTHVKIDDFTAEVNIIEDEQPTGQTNRQSDLNMGGKRSIPQQKRQRKTLLRRICSHPNFKNIDYPAALEYLKSQPIGEVVIRPSSKGYDHLAITYKFFEDTYVNLDVLEKDKRDPASVGATLFIGDRRFEDLDEIIATVVNKIIEHTQKLVENSHYTDKTGDQIEQELRAEKERNPASIPYKLSLNRAYPTRIWIHYLPTRSIRKDTAIVTPKGFIFRKRLFDSAQRMINGFKRSYQSSDIGGKPLSDSEIAYLTLTSRASSSSDSRRGSSASGTPVQSTSVNTEWVDNYSGGRGSSGRPMTPSRHARSPFIGGHRSYNPSGSGAMVTQHGQQHVVDDWEM